ncbi:IAD-1alpha dynein heavy chain, partial [Aduncisulcus paluster]
METIGGLKSVLDKFMPEIEESALPENIVVEVRASLKKFSQALTLMMEELGPTVRIDYPRVPDGQASALAEDRHLVATFSQDVEKWTTVLNKTLRSVGDMVQESPGPRAIVDVWRRKAATLSSVYSKLSHEKVTKVLAVLSHKGAEPAKNLQVRMSELSKRTEEAVDNTRFLSILEPHIRTIETAPLENLMTDVVSFLKNAKLVWTVSRYFNTDERMKGLLKEMTYLLVKRVKYAVNISQLLVPPKITAACGSDSTIMEDIIGKMSIGESVSQKDIEEGKERTKLRILAEREEEIVGTRHGSELRTARARSIQEVKDGSKSSTGSSSTMPLFSTVRPVGDHLLHAVKVLNESCNLLEKWKNTFMEKKREIETEGSHRKWEFSPTDIFEESKIAVSRCETLLKIVLEVHSFVPLYSSQLSSLSSTSSLTMVTQNLYKAILPFVRKSEKKDDIFSRNGSNWSNRYQHYQQSIRLAQAACSDFIDGAFKTVRNVDSAIQLLVNWQKEERSTAVVPDRSERQSSLSSSSSASRGTGGPGSKRSSTIVLQKLSSKVPTVVDMLLRQMDDIGIRFDKQKYNPPIRSSRAPVSEAVKWVRDQFNSIKSTYTIFKQLHKDEISQKSVADKFSQLATKFKQYEQEIVGEFKKVTQEKVLMYLNAPLLIEVPKTQSIEESFGITDDDNVFARLRKAKKTGLGAYLSIGGEGTSARTTRKHAEATSRALRTGHRGSQSGETTAVLPSSDELCSSLYILDSPNQVIVNFHPSLEPIMAESKALSAINVTVPASLNSTLLQREKYIGRKDMLVKILSDLNNAIASLDKEEKQLILPTVKNNVAKVLLPGFVSLNWNSLSNDQFIVHCEKAVRELKDTTDHIKKESKSLATTIADIKSIKLFKPPKRMSYSEMEEILKKGMEAKKTAAEQSHRAKKEKRDAFLSARDEIKRSASKKGAISGGPSSSILFSSSQSHSHVSKVTLKAMKKQQEIASMSKDGNIVFNTPTLEEFVSIVQREMHKNVKVAIDKYRSVTNLLRNLEASVCGTQTGSNPIMKHYYAVWEAKLFGGLKAMVTKGLLSYINTLSKFKDDTATIDGKGKPLFRVTDGEVVDGKKILPLFQVSAQLIGHSVKMTPSLTKVDEELVRIAQLIVGSIVPFYSWIPGTCIPENEREQWEREEKERKEKEAAQSQTKELEKVKKQVKSSNLTGRVTARSGRITARSGRSSTMSMRSDGSM